MMYKRTKDTLKFNQFKFQIGQIFPKILLLILFTCFQFIQAQIHLTSDEISHLENSENETLDTVQSDSVVVFVGNGALIYDLNNDLADDKNVLLVYEKISKNIVEEKDKLTTPIKVNSIAEQVEAKIKFVVHNVQRSKDKVADRNSNQNILNSEATATSKFICTSYYSKFKVATQSFDNKYSTFLQPFERDLFFFGSTKYDFQHLLFQLTRPPPPFS